jgi:hypothetical protein
MGYKFSIEKMYKITRVPDEPATIQIKDDK